MNPTPNHPVQPELFTYLRLLAAHSERGQFIDVRWMTATGEMRQRFIPALRIVQAALLITRMAPQTDVYVGVALRNGRDHGGGKNAISGSRLLYIECDHPDSRTRLENFACSPSMIIASGSPEHLHVYWSLKGLASSLQVENANRRLALALGGDLASVDIARILRPPATMNHKHSPPLPVQTVAHDPDARYELSTIIADLPRDPQPARLSAPRTSPRRVRRSALDRALLAISAAEYVRVLADREPNRAGKVLCPFHEERNPSLQLYPDGTFYCYGRQCRKGGTIFDFAAALWLTGQSPATPLRGEQFLAVRRRLAEIFLAEDGGVCA